MGQFPRGAADSGSQNTQGAFVGLIQGKDGTVDGSVACIAKIGGIRALSLAASATLLLYRDQRRPPVEDLASNVTLLLNNTGKCAPPITRTRDCSQHR